MVNHFPKSMSLQVFVAATAFLFSQSTGFSAAPQPPSVDPTFNLPPVKQKLPDNKQPQANWIWASTTTDNQTIYVRRDFELKDLPALSELYVNADDSCTVWVNGIDLPQQVPENAVQDSWKQTQKWDITPDLKQGRNVIAIQGHNVSVAAGIAACLMDDTKLTLFSDSNWKLSTDNTLPAAWTSSEFDDSSWAPATEVAAIGGGDWANAGSLIGWPLPQSGGTTYLAHINLPFQTVVSYSLAGGKCEGLKQLPGNLNQVVTVNPSNSPGSAQPSIILDMGKEIAGRVMFDALSSGELMLSRGESIDEALNSPWDGPTTVTLTPGQTTTTEYSAFRYVRLQIQPGAAPLKFRVYVDHKYYPVKYLGSFACSDPELTKIWYTGAYTCHLCMQENIWDAPKRDRQMWSGDLNVSGEVINDVFADKFLMEKTLDGLYRSSGSGDINGIPGYSCAWISTIADFHRHIGDYAFLSKQHDRIIALLEHLRTGVNEGGVFTHVYGSWMYTDWSPDFGDDSPLSEATTDFALIRAVHDAVFLFNEMGDTASAEKYDSWANQLTDSARKSLADPASGTYSSRLQENAMAIDSGTATQSQVSAIYNSVLDPSSESWNRDGVLFGQKPVMSPYYGDYIIQSMSLAGHTANALKIVKYFWGGMLNEGATTFWEEYDPLWPKVNFHGNLPGKYHSSLCHGWSAGPTSFLTEHVLGIRPTAGGFRTTDIVPDIGNLTWVQGDVPTPNGIIHVHAENLKKSFNITLHLPSSVEATVGVLGNTVTVNSKKVRATRHENGRVYVTIDCPGSYKIVGS